MLRTTLMCLVLVLSVSQFGLKLLAQDQNYLYGTGAQTWGINIPIENGFINVANGEVHLELSLAGTPQRGSLGLDERLVYDSRIWHIVLNGSSYNFLPTNVPVSYSGANPICTGNPQSACTGSPGTISLTNINVPNSMAGWRFVSGADTGIIQAYLSGTITNLNSDSVWHWGWTDPSGTNHLFNAVTGTVWCPSCAPSSATAYAMDGSGYYLVVTNYSSAIVYDPAGNEVYPSIIDRNGNTIAKDANGNLVDTIGRTPVKVSTSGNKIYYDVLTIGGVTKRYTVTTETINANTYFHQSGTNEYSGTLTAIQSIALPDGSQYSFTYDSGTSSGYYGELQSMTLPTGGIVSFAYQNFLDSYNNENRWVSTYSGGHGSYTFTPSVVSQCSGSGTFGCQENMTAKDGDGNYVVYLLTLNNGAWNTEMDYHNGQGGEPAITTTTYNFANSAPTWFGAGSAWVTASNTTTKLPDTGQIATTQYAFTYPWSGKPSSVKAWDYYTGTQPATPTKEVDYTYGKIVNGAYFASQVSQLDSTGTLAGQIIYNYDQGTPSTAAGATGLNAAPGGTNRGNLTQVTTGVGSTISISSTYDTAGTKLSDVDPNGNTTTYSYLCADTYPSTTTLPLAVNGAKLAKQVIYDCSSGLITSTKDPNGYVNNLATTYTYFNSGSNIGRLQQVTFPDSGGVTYSYPSSLEVDQVAAQASSLSLTTKNVLDSYGRPSQNIQLAPEGTISSETTYDAGGKPVCVTAAHLQGTTSVTDGKTCTYRDILGRPGLTTLPDGNDTSIGYTGSTATVSDELNHVRALTYDAFGRLTKVMEPNASNVLTYETDYAYNVFDQLTQVDQWGAAKGASSPGERQRAFAYNSLGRMIAERIPENQSSAVVAGLTCSGTVAGTKWTSCFGYDANGNLASSTDNAGNAITYAYDTLGRVTSEVYPGGKFVFGYDGNNESGTPLSSFGIPTSNAIGRLSLSGNQVNQGHAYGYDAMGRITVQTDYLPSKGAWNTTIGGAYDLAGHLVALTYPDGRVVSQSYDSAARLTGVTYSKWGATAVGTPYYAATAFLPPGQPKTASFGNGINLSFVYDVRQNVNSGTYTNSSGATVWGKSFTWDKNSSNLLLMTDQLTGYGRQYTYDTMNRVISANDVLVNGPGATHSTGTITIGGGPARTAWINCHGPRSTCTQIWDSGSVKVVANGITVGSGGYGNGSSTSDIATALAASINSNPQNPVTATASANVVTLTSVVAGSQTNYSLSTSVSWDSADFATASFTSTASGSSMTGGSGTPPSPALNESYSYDPFGNLTQSGNFSFAQSFNQLNQVVGYSYDANGDQNTDILNHSLSFNALGLLSSVAGGAETYVYDPDGNRVEVHGSTITDYVYFNGHMIASSTGGVYTDFIYAGGSLVAEVGGTQTAVPAYRVTDNVGSFAGNPTASGLSGSMNYAPYGQLLAGTNSDPFGFAALQWDATTATNHATFRQYSPQQGRWQSPDPFGGSYEWTNPQSLNRYAYVNGRPTLFNDPSGLDGGGATGPVCGVALASGGANVGADVGCGLLAAFDWILAGIFGGGSSFHGSLQPRPSANPWDDKWGVPYGGLTNGVQQALGLPSVDDIGCNPVCDATGSGEVTISAYKPPVRTCLGRGIFAAAADLTGLSNLPAADPDHWRWSSDKFGFMYIEPEPEVSESAVAAGVAGVLADGSEKGAKWIRKSPQRGLIRDWLRIHGYYVSSTDFSMTSVLVEKWAGRVGKVLALKSGYDAYRKCMK